MDRPDGPDARRALRVEAAAAADAHGGVAPAVLLLDAAGEVLSLGRPEMVGATPEARTVSVPNSLLLPGLVNAHAHLDLTSIGPRPFDAAAGFAAWAGMIRRKRPAAPEAIADSVRAGVEASLRGGTAIVGDIAGNRGLAAAEALRHLSLRGVSYIEVFGIGAAEDAGIGFLDELGSLAASFTGAVRLGVSPHASYSCGDRLYARAAALGLPLATHLSETLEELRFNRDGEGPLADLLREVGVWSDEVVGWHATPIERLLPILARSGAAIAHGNYLDHRDLERLAEIAAEAARAGISPVGLVYCPRASAYFGHPIAGEPPHRYRELRERGVPVALGTDGMVCLDTPDRLSVLDEMRLLHRRDGADPSTLLAMATVDGATLLGEPLEHAGLATGDRPAGLLAIDLPNGRDVVDAGAALRTALRLDVEPRWLLEPRGAP
jgi:cytosine/adenosine deaminase-related metal-dependent hydrolase